MQNLTMFKSKLHRAVVTNAELNYEEFLEIIQGIQINNSPKN